MENFFLPELSHFGVLGVESFPFLFRLVPADGLLRQMILKIEANGIKQKMTFPFEVGFVYLVSCPFAFRPLDVSTDECVLSFCPFQTNYFQFGIIMVSLIYDFLYTCCVWVRRMVASLACRGSLHLFSI